MAVNNLLSTISGGAPKRTDLKGFRGFTLAEVLITLVIIGVIAAMTIPTLMNNTNKQEYVSRLKKTYSVLTQATQKIIAEEGMPRGDIGGWATSSEAVYNMYKKYLSNTKECGIGTGCFQGTYLRMNNTTQQYDAGRYTFVLADGTEVGVGNNDFSSDCSLNSNGTRNTCQVILVDINGAKGPNEVGRDAFAFSLLENGLVPTGCGSNSICVKGVSHGWDCTCKVLRENAMNY